MTRRWPNWRNSIQVHLTQIGPRKQLLLEHAADVFANAHSLAEDSEGRVQELHAKIGELTMERDSLSQRARALPRPEVGEPTAFSSRLPPRFGLQRKPP